MDPFSDRTMGESAGARDRPGRPDIAGRPGRPGPLDRPGRRRELIFSLACGLIGDHTEIGRAFADSVTATMAIMMAAVPPKERTVFVLREAFGMPYSEISTTLETQEDKVRDLNQRARQRMHQHADGESPSGSVERRLMRSCVSRDMDALASLLATDARLDLYHAGIRQGVAKTAEGRERVARHILEYCDSSCLRGPFHTFHSGELGILWSSAGSPIGALVVETENELIGVVTAISGNGRIAG